MAADRSRLDPLGKQRSARPARESERPGAWDLGNSWGESWENPRKILGKLRLMVEDHIFDGSPRNSELPRLRAWYRNLIESIIKSTMVP